MHLTRLFFYVNWLLILTFPLLISGCSKDDSAKTPVDSGAAAIEAAAGTGNNPVIMQRLGDVLVEAGRPAEAAEVLADYLRLPDGGFDTLVVPPQLVASMATPNAAGSAVLLMDYYGRLFPGQHMLASTLRRSKTRLPEKQWRPNIYPCSAPWQPGCRCR